MPPVHDIAADLANRLVGASHLDTGRAIDQALEQLAAEAEASRVSITIYHDDATIETSHEWTDADMVPHRPVIGGLASADFEYSYHVALRGDVLSAPDLDGLPIAASAEKASFSAFGVRAVLQVPIIVDGECIGVIGVNDRSVRDAWSEDLIESMRRIAQVVGEVIARERPGATERRANEEADRADRADRQRNDMLSDLHHDLRTPLHAILGYTELLELDRRDERDREALFQIHLQSRNLLATIEELLSRTERSIDPDGHTDLWPLLNDIVSSLSAISERRSVEVRLSDRVEGVGVVDAEPERIRRVVYCVLSGLLSAARPGDVIAIDLGDASTGHLRITAEQIAIGSTNMVPLARALITGCGSIDIAPGSSVDLALHFDDQGSATPG